MMKQRISILLRAADFPERKRASHCRYATGTFQGLQLQPLRQHGQENTTQQLHPHLVTNGLTDRQLISFGFRD